MAELIEKSTGGVLDKNGFSYVDENGEKQQLKRAQTVSFGDYKMTKEQLELKRSLMVKCIDQHPSIDKHTIEIMIDYYIMHPDKLDADNRIDGSNNDDYKKYLGEN